MSCHTTVVTTKKYNVRVTSSVLIGTIEYQTADQVASRSKAWVCGRSLVRIAGPNPAGGGNIVCLSRRGLCDEPILRPEGSYRVSVCDQMQQ